MFKKPGYPKLEFEIDKKNFTRCVISALKAKRLLHNGCEAYLANVVDKSTLEVALDSVSVVREFPDVFLKDLSSLPPNRELEFKIELLSGSAPISISPYRMTPTELKQLKTFI